MPDRLSELRRQRALVEEHLAWLDREIDAASAGPPPGPSAESEPLRIPLVLRPTPAPNALRQSEREAAAILAQAAVAPRHAAAPDRALVDADAIMAEYSTSPRALKSDVRKGCLLYFFAALGLVVLGVIGLYYALHKE